MVCKASAEEKVSKVSAAVATVATTVVAHPAFALVSSCMKLRDGRLCFAFSYVR
jgi:hypothetical protein